MLTSSKSVKWTTFFIPEAQLRFMIMTDGNFQSFGAKLFLPARCTLHVVRIYQKACQKNKFQDDRFKFFNTTSVTPELCCSFWLLFSFIELRSLLCSVQDDLFYQPTSHLRSEVLYDCIVLSAAADKFTGLVMHVEYECHSRISQQSWHYGSTYRTPFNIRTCSVTQLSDWTVTDRSWQNNANC